MKYFLTTLGILCLTLFLPMGSAFGLEAPSESIVEAAEEGLEKFAKDLTEVAPVKNCENLSLGFAFQMYTISPDVLLSDNASDLNEMSSPMEMWRFVVKQKQNPVALISVAKEDGEWKAVMFGSYSLAQEVSAMKRTWMKKRGSELKFIRIFQATSDIVAVKQSGETLGFAPLRSAQKSLKMNRAFSAQSLMQGSELIQTLKDRVAETLDSEQSLY